MTRDEALRDAIRAITECFPDRWETILDRLDLWHPRTNDENDAHWPIAIDHSGLPHNRIFRFGGGRKRVIHGPARVGQDDRMAHAPYAAIVEAGATLEWDGPGVVIQSLIGPGIFPPLPDERAALHRLQADRPSSRA